jgi:hypothetical protein
MAPQSASRIEALCAKMAALYGNAWTSQYGDDPNNDAARTWASALAGLTGEQLATGLRACVAEGREFPPSAPRFRGMCLGIPDFSAVNNEILTTTSDKRTAFARLVWSFIVDPYAYRHCSAKDAERLRRDAYEQACEHLMTGGGLPPEPAGELEHDETLFASGIPKTREARVEKLRKMLGTSFSEVAVTVRNEDELRRHHKLQEQTSALQELGAQYRREDAEQELLP